ncbi:MAG: NB-ARC domain-containing protein, partial [Scytonema sp. PMC 1069.18]|nr:NB-ARC domain-containing protein [Scytonema sp. PMC 1069.18]
PDTNKEEFIEARNHWELEKLYVDLGLAKGKSLTPVEKKFLRGLLCGFSPAEIAITVYQSRSSSTVRVYLSNGLYKYIEDMLSHQAGSSVKVKNWSRVTHLLEKAGYKKARIYIERTSNQKKINTIKTTDDLNMQSAQPQDWGEAIDVSLFSGRETELTQIQEWIIKENCRLIVLLGMGGIGKTTFSAKLVEQIKDKFEYVIWRSLRFAPPLEVFCNQLIQILSPHEETKNSECLDSSIVQLMDYLRSSRCLIVLDNLDSILYNEFIDAVDTPSTFLGSSYSKKTSYPSTYPLPQICYRQGYEGYGELIRRIGDSLHQSCFILTSREKPQEIAALEGKSLPVRCLKLTGLTSTEIQKIIISKGLVDSNDEEIKFLSEWYAGNPLFIKLASTTIQELFDGSINAFLEQGIIAFGEIRSVLDQQFNRLSSLEKIIMYWLALNSDLFSVRKLQKDMVPRVSQRLILEAIELLQRRSLIERQGAKFSQIPVLIEYIAEQLVEENFKFMGEKEGSLLTLHTILEAKIKNHIRDMRLNAEI